MDNQELKPTLSLPYVAPQQGENVHMNCTQEEDTSVIHRTLNDNSLQNPLQVPSSLLGNRMSDGNPVAGSEVPNARDLIGSSESSLRNVRDSPRNGSSTRESLLPKNFTPRGNSHRAPKRKKETVIGSPHGRPREISFSPIRPTTERSNSTPPSPRHVSHPVGQIRHPLHQASYMAPQGAQVSFSRISSDNSQNGDLLDSLQNSSPHECHISTHRTGSGGSQAADLTLRRAKVRAWGNRPLSVVDADLWEIMEREKVRQWRGVELIASENFTSQAVIEALGSHLTNKYSEGLPGSRYYGGNEYIDKIESLCISRALAAFHLDPKEWGVNVQPYSCTSANFAVFTALLQPKDRIMGLDVPSGGHVSHGYYTSSGKKVSGASIFFESLPFKVNPQNGLIDFDTLEKFALNYRPKILICGGSAYPREWDYCRFRDIANKCGAILMCDMAHISGLIAAKECASPFDDCDIVTSTTHKSLRGPRGGMIFYRKGLKLRRSAGADNMYDFEDKINFAVHPSLQGGPHNNHIAALAVALKQVAAPEYQQYICQVKKNAQALASALMKQGCVLVTGGTDNHLLLWDLRNRGLTGNRLEKVCEMCHMTVNKNAVFGDSSALGVGGVRIGTPAMTSRGCIEADFEVIADFLLKAVQIAESVQSEHGKLQKDFMKGLQNNKDIIDLRNRIEKFASKFEMPGFEVTAKNFSQ